MENRISPAEVERTRITDIETKELIKFNNAIRRRVQLGQLQEQAFKKYVPRSVTASTVASGQSNFSSNGQRKKPLLSYH